MRLYVGNLPYKLTNTQLSEAFSAHGDVINANIIIDRETKRSKGFGFVEMTDSAAGEAAIEALNGQPLAGRNLVVNQARPRAEK